MQFVPSSHTADLNKQWFEYSQKSCSRGTVQSIISDDKWLIQSIQRKIDRKLELKQKKRSKLISWSHKENNAAVSPYCSPCCKIHFFTYVHICIYICICRWLQLSPRFVVHFVLQFFKQRLWLLYIIIMLVFRASWTDSHLHKIVFLMSLVDKKNKIKNKQNSLVATNWKSA